MTIERAVLRTVPKPWGSTDLHPWSSVSTQGVSVGELWFQRANDNAPHSALLLKLLFTTQPLSIQVHPDDVFAQSIGLANGKTEAWYILGAVPGAQVAIGLKHPLTSTELRLAVTDGSIVDLVRWHEVRAGEVYDVPAGTIHAIGAGIVLAEIQQRSDTTFRLFDYGRQRELHADQAVAAAYLGLPLHRVVPEQFSDSRTALIVNPHFVLEHVDCVAGSRWTLNAAQETWILVIDGGARIGEADACIGDAMFVEVDHVEIHAGAAGMRGLLAYPGPRPDLNLLTQRVDTNAPDKIRALSRAPFLSIAADDISAKPQEVQT